MSSLYLPLALALALVVSLRAATIEGRVLEDHSGASVPSVSVRMSRDGMPGLAADLETDGQGRFEAPELAEGDYRIDVSKPNYLGTTIRLHLTGRGALTTIRMIHCAAITGQVTDRDGRPVPGAAVFAIAKPVGGAPLQRDFSPGHYNLLDQSGNYRLYNLPPGSYLMAVSYGASSTTVGSVGYAPPPGRTGSGVLYYPDNARPQFLDLPAGDERRNLNFSILPAALFTVSGRVEPADPKNAFWLALSSVSEPAIAVAVVPMSADHNFRFEGVPQGFYNLTAVGPTTGYGGRGAILKGDALFARARVEVGGEDVKGIVLSPEKGKPVTFVLHAANGASANCPGTAQLGLAPIEDLGAMIERSAALKLGQEETVPFLAPAKYSMALKGLGDNCFLATDEVLDVSQSKGTVALTMVAAGSIRGRLNTGGSPSSDFSVVLIANDGVGGANAVVPDGQSQFAFTGLRPGLYRIAARPAAGTTAARWLAVADGAIDIEVRAGSTLQIDLAAQAPQEQKP